MLMIPYFFKILPIERECMLVVRVYLAQCIPQLIDLFSRQIYFLPQLIQYVEIRYECGQVGPELNLQIRYDLDGLRHFLIQSFEFNDISQLWVDLLMFQMLGLNEVLDDLLVAEDSKLLLERGLLFECNVKL
jgi:hypothetical protein